MLQESHGHHGSLRMILNRAYGSLGAQRAVIALDQNAISKFQGFVHHKKNFIRRAEFNDRILGKSVLVFVNGAAISVGVGVAIPISIAIAGAMGAAEFDWDAHWRGVRKKLGQAAYEF